VNSRYLIFSIVVPTQIYAFNCRSDGKIKFAMTQSGYYGEKTITSGSALTEGVWKHVAVTLSGDTGTLYINERMLGKITRFL